MLAQVVLIKTTNQKFGECVVYSACEQNLPLTDYTEINKPVETSISICSFQLKHALFMGVEPLLEYKKTKSPLSIPLQPLTYAEAALCGTTAL